MDSGSASSSGTSEAAKPEAAAAAATATSPHPGCGCAASASATPSSSPSSLTVRVTPTTGGQFDLQASKTDTVETLKKLISKKLKVPKERICLLHRDRQLREGTLQENQLVDGSRLTLLPSVETGLLAQRPEQSVMQALESLNDSQVNDFLSGKAPLNLTMRLGDHMMLIQLQLSTVTPSGGRRSGASPSTSASAASSRAPAPSAASASAAATGAAATASRHGHAHSHPHAPATSSASSAAAASSKPSPSLPAPEMCRCDSSSSASGPASAAAAAAAARPTLDTRALAEASRNLTQTLKQLSSEDNARARRQGAIIESMHHHGKGVYSGTFSGTLNPALQDRFGRPKRDISTIIHILNDLLCATPQYRRHASRTQQQQQQQQHQHHHHQQQQHHHQQHQQHSAGPHAGTSTAVASSSAVAAAGAAASAVPGKLVAAASKAPHVSANQALSDESANLSRENQATRGKMEHLRLIMEERRARRRARREARAAPYTTQWSAKSEQLAPQSGVEPMDTTNSAEQSAPSTTAAEVGPPEPVVA